MGTDTSQSLSYRDAGVDIERGNRLVDRIKPVAERTRRPGVINSLGGFGGLFELPIDRYRKPVLVSSTDGVGTKLKLAIAANKHQAVGIDLVAMCANDLIVQGAEPLFFLDYYATGRLNLDVAAQVIEGIGHGCELAGMALIGGETAEMPGMYGTNDYDLAGFCVGIVEKDLIVDGSKVKPDDVVIGLASSGPHSNGYSLIRKILEVTQADLSTAVDGQPLGEQLLEPTRIYVQPLLELIGTGSMHAAAHITGGGLTENLPRILPPGTRAILEQNSWTRPVIFDWLQHQGRVADDEMLRTFNCGVGMALVVPASDVELALETLHSAGETAWRIGWIERAASGTPQVVCT